MPQPNLTDGHFVCASCNISKPLSELPIRQRKTLGGPRSIPRCYGCRKRRSVAFDSGVKRCTVCKETKTIDQFSPLGPANGGYLKSKCKPCSSKISDGIRNKAREDRSHFFCSRCRQSKPREAFSGGRSSREYRCKECEARRAREGNDTPSKNYQTAKCSARRRGISWDLTKEQYVSLRTSDLCHYCRGPMTQSGIGLDRCENELGYAIDNVVPCCKECNLVKGCMFTKEEMELIMGPAVSAVLERRTMIDNPMQRVRRWGRRLGRPRKYQE